MVSFISLNYEDILEKTIKKHFNYDVDYVIKLGKKASSKKSIITLGGVVAPAGSFKREIFYRGTRVLEEMGFKVFLPAGLLKIP